MASVAAEVLELEPFSHRITSRLSFSRMLFLRSLETFNLLLQLLSGNILTLLMFVHELSPERG